MKYLFLDEFIGRFDEFVAALFGTEAVVFSFEFKTIFFFLNFHSADRIFFHDILLGNYGVVFNIFHLLV